MDTDSYSFWGRLVLGARYKLFWVLRDRGWSAHEATPDITDIYFYCWTCFTLCMVFRTFASWHPSADAHVWTPRATRRVMHRLAGALVTLGVRQTLTDSPESHDIHDARTRGTIACSRSDETGDALVVHTYAPTVQSRTVCTLPHTTAYTWCTYYARGLLD
jgi:hypothetical protein